MKKSKQKGGTQDVVTASVNMIKSMVTLGETMFKEMSSITNIQSDINNAASPSVGTPNVIDGPPKFHAPKLNQNDHNQQYSAKQIAWAAKHHLIS